MKGSKPPTVVVASAAKVGSTWLTNILAALECVEPPDRQKDKIFKRVEYVDIHDQKERKLIQENREHILFKTHSFFSEELFTQDRIKVVHISRDLRDMLTSLVYFHQYRARIGELSDNILKFSVPEYFAHLMNNGDFSRWVEIMKSWLEQDSDQIIHIRYEDLKRDTFSTVNRICNFLGFNCGENDILSAINQASFELHTNGRHPGIEDRNSFYRKGIIGDWKNHFDESLIDLFVTCNEGSWNQLLVSQGYEKDADWYLPFTGANGRLNSYHHRPLHIALVHHWPGHKNSELDIIQRIYDILIRQGHHCWIISPLGHILDKGEHLPDVAHVRDYHLDLVFYLHYSAPKLLDTFSYITNWNPAEYLLKDPFTNQNLDIDQLEYLKTCFLSHDVVLPSGSEEVDHLVEGFELFRKTRTLQFGTILHPTCQVMENLDFPGLKNFKVFYIGARWEKILDAERHGSLLGKLDRSGDIHFYGVRERNGKFLWEGIRNYQGELPFDGGKSIIETSNQYGVSLVLHTPQHRKSAIVSSRIFQACAAKTVIIADDNPWILQNFGDSVLTFEYRHSDHDWNQQEIEQRIAWIRSNPKGALEKARESHRIFKEKFNLQLELSDIIDHHSKQLSRFEEKLCANDDGSMVHIIYVVTAQSMDAFYLDIFKQKKVKFKCWIFGEIELLQTLRFRFGQEDCKIEYDLIDWGHRPFSRGQALLNIKEHIKTGDTFIFYHPGQRWGTYHLTMLKRTIQDGSTIVRSGIYVKPDYFDHHSAGNYLYDLQKSLSTYPDHLQISDLIEFRTTHFALSSFMFSASVLSVENQLNPVSLFDYGCFMYILAVTYLRTGVLPDQISKVTCHVETGNDGFTFDPYIFNRRNYQDEKSIYQLIFKNTSLDVPIGYQDNKPDFDGGSEYATAAVSETEFDQWQPTEDLAQKDQESENGYSREFGAPEYVRFESTSLLSFSGLRNRIKYFKERMIIKNSGLFDASWYMRQYRDVEASGQDPLNHYIMHGWRECRDPSPSFRTAEYLRRKP